MKLQLVNLSKLDMSVFGEVRKYGDPQQMRALLLDAPAAAKETYLLGMDISDWNGRIDVKKAKSMGVSFIIIKATQGRAHVQKQYKITYENAMTEGLGTGFYHYFDSGTDGIAQFDNHMNAVTGLKPTYVSTIDVEYVDAEIRLATSNLQHMQYEYEKLYSRFWMTYTSVGMWNTAISAWSRWKESPLMVANWNVPEPALPRDWNGIGWKIWQHTVAIGQGPKYGTTGSQSVDLDYSKAHYLEVIKFGATPPPPPPEPEPEPEPPPDGLPTFPALPKAKVIATSALMVRSGPGRYYNVVGKLAYNDTPEIIRGALDEYGNIWLQHGFNQWSAMVYQNQPLMKWI